MPNTDKLEKLILLLIRETTEGQIKWRAADVSRERLRGTDDVIADFFTTVFKGQEIAVFERRYKGYDPDNETTYWTSADGFAFLHHGEITWETEEQPLLGNLLKVAKESAADIDGVLDSLLS
jgi:hypothetical protein